MPREQTSGGASPEVDLSTASKDAEIHQNILLRLYRIRRDSVAEPGIAGWLLQDTLNCSEAELEFHLWYLKSKGLIEGTEHGTLAITIQGVDHVLETSQQVREEKLLISQFESDDDPA